MLENIIDMIIRLENIVGLEYVIGIIFGSIFGWYIGKYTISLIE